MKQCAWVEADKYVNVEDYYDVAPFKPQKNIRTRYGEFNRDGSYVIYEGFLYSANFPAINSDDSRRGAMIHDFFYLLMKQGHLSRDFRYEVDYYFYNILLEDGMIELRAYYWFRAVRVGGDDALDSPPPKVTRSPQVRPADPIHFAQALLGR